MADPNTPHSTAVATQPMYYQGLSVNSTINSDHPDIKARLAEYCRGMKVCSKIQPQHSGLITATFQNPLQILSDTMNTLHGWLLENTALV
jgi:hypothetical protein